MLFQSAALAPSRSGYSSRFDRTMLKGDWQLQSWLLDELPPIQKDDKNICSYVGFAICWSSIWSW